MSKMTEAMGIKPYVIQHCRCRRTRRWETGLISSMTRWRRPRRLLSS